MKKKVLSILLAAFILSSFASCGKEEQSSEAQTSDAVSKEQSVEASTEASEEKSEEVSEEKSEEVSEEETFMAYKEDKSGYLSNTQTENLNFNSLTIKAKDFKGTFTGLVINENGRLTLDDKEETYIGVYESEVINVGKFGAMLVSWNAVCGDGKITVMASYEADDGTWSDYFSYGTWSDKDNISTSKSVSNAFGQMNIDTLVPSKTPTGKIKIKITVNRSGIYRPVIENITIATPQMNSATPSEYPESAWVKVPMRSQRAPENGADGSVMCSSTTVAMALEYLGHNQTTLETAKGTWDKGFGGYGNWLFSVAEAGAHGYYAFCDFYTEDMMKYALSKGYSIGCSTQLTDEGHIVLVVGYETVNGVDYYIVNDPNVNPSSVKETRYTCSRFNALWLESRFDNKGVVYVFQGQY